MRVKKIVLISCVSKKRKHRAKVSDLYISLLFELALQYARKLQPNVIFVLSAEYGLLDLDTEIEPYGHNTEKNDIGATKGMGLESGRLTQGESRHRERLLCFSRWTGLSPKPDATLGSMKSR